MKFKKLVLFGITMLSMGLTYASPIAYVVKKDGTVDFINSFVSVSKDGVYQVEVITDTSMRENKSMRIGSKNINLSEIQKIELFKGNHKLFPEINEFYGPNKMNEYFVIKALNGSSYESPNNMTLQHSPKGNGVGMSYAVTHPRPGVYNDDNFYLKYYDLDQNLKTLDQDPVLMVLNDPTAIKSKLKEINNQRKQERKNIVDSENTKIATNSNFRKSLEVGSNTNCGPVIELKGKMIKIYSPVKDYGNEHWISRDQLFPQGYQCIFANGRYTPPQ